MSSIRRESLEEGGSSVHEPLTPSWQLMDARRSGDSIRCVLDSVRKLRVLVVDDNHDCADSLSRLVNRWGYDVRTAYDGAAALALMDIHQPDVVLLDLSMPRMDGCQMARQLRRHPRFDQTRLIAVTGWTDEAQRQLCDKVGFDHYLLKPIELASLELLLFRERHRLAQAGQEVEKTHETGGTGVMAERKSAFLRVDSAVCP
jgi:CheY-like chemotaxis protein